MRLLTLLFALVAHLVAFSSAAAMARHLAATPADLHRRTPLGGKGGGAGGFDLWSALDHSKETSSSMPVDNTHGKFTLDGGSITSKVENVNISGGSKCGTGTAVGTMWIADQAYTCAPVNGGNAGNYCISTNLSNYRSSSNLCTKHSDCGSGWCIKVNGAGSACWSSATGCDDYYHGNGTPI